MKSRRPPFLRPLVMSAGLLAVVVVLHPARAATLDPGQWRRYNGWDVTSFAVTGVPADLQADLVRGLKYTGRRRLLRPRERPEFGASGLLEDLRRVRLFLAARGFPASRVEVDLQPDADARRLAVTFVVDPGPEVLVQEVRLTGWPDAVSGPKDGDPDLPALGERFSDERAQAGALYLAGLLQDAGYAEVTVELKVRPDGAARVLLEYLVTPGSPYVIGSVDVAGCSEDLLPLARRVTDIKPGTDYGATLLRDAAFDLRTTQLFRQVELTTEPVAGDSLALAVSLANAQWRSLSASIGSWSDNPWMLRAAWTHRNLFKGGRGLRVGGQYATHDQRFGVEVFKLGLFSPRAITTLGAVAIREDEDAYLSREFGASLLQSFRPRGRGLWQLGVAISSVEVDSKSPDASEVPSSQDWLLEIYADRKWDWTDDMLYPKRGGYIKAAVTYAPAAAFFGASYVQVQVDGAGYRALLGGLNGAVRLRLGWSRPIGENEEVLANRRFYAGGYNTMRGYERRRLGPRDSEGNPVGGETTLLAGVELRRHLFWILDGAVFLDAGDVWRAAGETRLASLKSAAGADLDLRTPLGPLRVGYAWNLGEVIPGEPTKLWHFGIGYPW